MKAEERHELRENDLASWLQYGLWAFLKQNGSYIVLVLALAFLGYRLWAYYEQKQEIARQTAWAQLRDASATDNPIKTLEDVLDTSTLNPVKAQACFDLGQLYGRLAAIPEELNRRQMSRAEVLSKAYDNYAKILTLQGDEPVLAAKAHLGMASVYEDRAEWDKAKAEYEIITKDKLFAGTAFVDLAKSWLATLDDRRNAPRLATMIPPPPAPKPVPGLPGSGGLLQGLPGLPGGGALAPTTNSSFSNLMLGPQLPASASTAPAPAGPEGPPAPITPFGGPSLPGLSPATPATAPVEPAPASQPK
jgi:predicted negative regulator of RcsB-dependent stress response